VQLLACVACVAWLPVKLKQQSKNLEIFQKSPKNGLKCLS